MSLPELLDALATTGRVRAPARDDLPPADLAAADALLERFDARARAEEPAPVPGLDADAARWAAVRLYRACQALAHREVEAEVVREALAMPCPSPPSPEAAHAADLTLRWLPDVLALGRGLAADDPLVEGLQALARAWPLSSVGARGLTSGELEPAALDVVLEHPGLRRRYRDRAIARGDLERLDDPRAAEAAREAVGLHPELAPRVARRLAQGGGAA